jgi:hypothetical protein
LLTRHDCNIGIADTEETPPCHVDEVQARIHQEYDGPIQLTDGDLCFLWNILMGSARLDHQENFARW